MRIDFVFSYWIYVWYLLYISKWVSHSPKFAISLGIVENIVLLCLMIWFGSNKKTIGYFVLINTIIKVIPLYTLRDESIRSVDVIVSLVFFLLYIFWLAINKKLDYRSAYESVLKNDTPFLSFMSFVKRKTGWGFL